MALAETGWAYTGLAIIGGVLVVSGVLAVRASKREEHNND